MKVSDKVVQNLRMLIEKNSMQVGDRLPAERKLCEQLGVSRSSLREAISQLTSTGMLVSKVGAGTYLQQLPANWSQNQIVEPLSNLIDEDPAYRFDVQEARMILEGKFWVMMIKPRWQMQSFIWPSQKRLIIWC